MDSYEAHITDDVKNWTEYIRDATNSLQSSDESDQNEANFVSVKLTQNTVNLH